MPRDPNDFRADAQTAGKGGTTNFLRADGEWAVPPGAGVADDSITNAKLAEMPANTIKANATAGTANPTDLAVPTNALVGRAGGNIISATIPINSVVGRVAGDLTAAAVVTDQISNDSVTYAKMQDVSAASRLLGRGSAAGAGDPEEIILGTNLSMAGTTINATGGGGDSITVNTTAVVDADLDDATPAAPAGGVNVKWQQDGGSPANISAHLAANDVSNTVLRDSSGFSVIGKATTGSGDPADIVAADETVLGRTGAGNLAFAQLATGQITNSAVTYAKIQNVSATDRFLGRDTAGAGVVEEISVASALAMLGAFSGVTLQAFTTPGANTYTPTTGMKHCIVISTGGGGGGGGGDATTAAGSTSAGGGGGAAGTCIEAFSAATIGVNQTVTIGDVGTAGSVTGGTGGTGGNTTFGALHTANGGVGGTGSGSANAATATSFAGGAGGVPTGGLLNITGGAGWNGFAGSADGTVDLTFASGGQGGGSFWGTGGRGAVNSQVSLTTDNTQTGSNGLVYGAGGGGGTGQNNATGGAGGTGMSGVCLVIEFT